MHVIIAKCYMAFVKCCVNQNARAVIAKCYMTFVKCYVSPAKRDMIIANYHDIIAKCYTLILTHITRHTYAPNQNYFQALKVRAQVIFSWSQKTQPPGF